MTSFIDTTLREGEQAPGVLFTDYQRQRIVDHLALVGVAEVEVGIAAELAEDCRPLLDHCRRYHPHLKTSLWARCRHDDIRVAAESGTTFLSLSIPVSDILLERKLDRNRSWAETAACDAIEYARTYGLTVSIGFEDATRADLPFLVSLAAMVEAAGAVRIRLADTVGLATPGAMASLVAAVVAAVKTAQIGVHTHNDFGMATANAIAALDAGAQWADGAVLGLGERSGCARIEELIGYYALVRGVSGLAPEHLPALAELVAACASRPVPGWAPVVGKDIFTCETGLHLHGLIADPNTYEPYPPERVGATRVLRLGAKCGRKAFTHLTGADGPADDGESLDQLRRVRATFRERGSSMDHDSCCSMAHGQRVSDNVLPHPDHSSDKQ